MDWSISYFFLVQDNLNTIINVFAFYNIIEIYSILVSVVINLKSVLFFKPQLFLVILHTYAFIVKKY